MYAKTLLKIFPILYFFLICLFHQSKLDGVPMALWNIQGNALKLKMIPKFQQNAGLYLDVLKFAEQKQACIQMLALNELSLEDFSVKSKEVNSSLQDVEIFLDKQPHMFISAIESPLSYPYKINCSVLEFEVSKNISEGFIQEISTAFRKSCVIIIHIRDAGWLEMQAVKKLFLLPFENPPFNIIGSLTGIKPSWIVEDAPPHISRKLLASDEANDKKIKFKNCILFSSDSGVISMTVKKLYNGTMNLTEPSTSNSHCENKSTTLLLTYKPAKNNVDQVVLKFLFKNRGASWQTYITMNITIQKKAYKNTFSYYDTTISAPYGKSFSCGSVLMRSTQQKYKVSLYFSNLKVQPFGVMSDEFNASHKCVRSVSIITYGIVEGAIISLLFLAIMGWGISHLASIQTAERFDDSKDNTASVMIITPL